MSILEGADPARIAEVSRGYFADRPAVDPEDYPERFRADDPDRPHTLLDTMGYINAVVSNKIPRVFSQDAYIAAFAKTSPLLRDLDRRLDPIVAPGELYSGTTYPEIICSLAMLMSKDEDGSHGKRAEFLVKHLGASETLRANLNGFGYDEGLQAGQPNAAWAVRRALTALGGMPAAFYPPILAEFTRQLGEAFPRHAQALSRMADDYRYVQPPGHAPAPA